MITVGYLITALVSIAVGFIIGKLYVERSLNVDVLKKQVDDTEQQMDQYKQDVATNLALTQKMIGEMKQSYDAVLKQVQLTSELVDQPASQNNDKNVQYFGSAEANQFLSDNNNNADSTSQQQVEYITQPPDYSTESSGLFNNSTEQTQIETSKSKWTLNFNFIIKSDLTLWW